MTGISSGSSKRQQRPHLIFSAHGEHFLETTVDALMQNGAIGQHDDLSRTISIDNDRPGLALKGDDGLSRRYAHF